MNVEFGWLRRSVVRLRILAMALLVAAGCMLLVGSRSRDIAAKPAADSGAVMAANSADAFSATLHSSGSAAPAAAQAAARSRARSLFEGLPLMFEPNQGQGNLEQSDARVKFVARGSGYSLYLGAEGAILNLNRSAARGNQAESVEMKLAGASPKAAITALEPLPGKSNYLLGNEPSKWRTGIPQFARVRYEQVYPGINLVFYGNQGHLEYDFQVAPGADPARAELEFDPAKQLALKDGALVVKGKGGSVRFEAPQVYQEIGRRPQPVEGHFVVRGAHRVGFAIGNYDHSRELVIDPLLSFATYFGGANNELNNSIAVDSALNIYLAGSTNSPTLPTVAGTTPFQSGLAAGATANVYIAKIQPPQENTPAVLLYVTYLGGNGTDIPAGIAVDGAGNPYVAGTTSSTNFPVTPSTAYQQSPTTGSSGPHIFVTKLNNTVTGLVYSSYLSGSGTDLASGMTIDGAGYLYVTGSTTSTNPQDYVSTVNWPVIQLPYGQAFQSTPRALPGVAQFFVTKVNTGSIGPASIAYSTYFGGGEYATTSPIVLGGGITVDSNGNIYFDGTTNFFYTGTNALVDFPILNAYQPCLDTTPPTVIVTPQTCSNTSSSSNPNIVNPDAFVAKINPNAPAGTGQLSWSTYVGGSYNDSGTGVAVDTGAAHVYIVGTTNSPDIGTSQTTTTTSNAFQRCLDTPQNPALGTACTPPAEPGAATDAFVAQLSNPAANCTTTSCLMTLTYFSFLGGTANEEGLAIAVDAADGALLTGWTQSSNFYMFPAPAGAGVQGTFSGTQDAFIARLNTAATSLSQEGSWTTFYGGSQTAEGTSITIDPNQNAYVAGDTNSPDLQVVEQIENYVPNSGYDAFVAQLGTASSMTILGSVTLGTNQTYVAAGSPVTFTYVVTNLGPDPATNFSVMDNLSPANTNGVTLTFQSASAAGATCTSAGSTATIVGCLIPSLQAGSTVTVTFVLVPASTGETQPFTGGYVSVISANNITLTHTSVSASMSDYFLQVSPPGANVAAGSTAQFQVKLQPDPVYSAAIALSCSGLPQAAACNFTTTSVTLPGSSPAGTTLYITTTARPITTGESSRGLRHFYALWLWVPGIALLGLGSRDRRRRRIAGMLLLLGVMSLLMFLPACSHATVQPPVSGTPAGQYTINVTATSGSDAKTYPIQLDVS